jgi:L-amino acid N-acyltransferase YncA
MTVRIATPDDAAAIAEVHVASWRSSYAGLVDAAYLAALDVGARTASWQRLTANPATRTIVAEHAGAIVGFCSAGPNRDATALHIRGEVYAIYLREEAKGQGHCPALFSSSMVWLRAGDLAPVRVWVFAENPRARAFYERMGGTLTGDPKTFELGGKTYTEVAYDWPA